MFESASKIEFKTTKIMFFSEIPEVGVNGGIESRFSPGIGHLLYTTSLDREK